MPTVSEAFAVASRHYREGNLELAKQLFLGILQLDPAHTEAHFKMGTIFLRQARPNDAAWHFQQILKANPSDAEAECNLGLAFASQSKLDNAVVHFREALRLNPGFVTAHNNLGIALRSQGKVEEALSCFEQALTLNPDFADAHYNLGNAFKSRENWPEARRHYDDALRLNPNNANAHNNLGSVLHNLKQLDDAIDHYREALKLDPNLAEAHRNLGTALLSQGRFDEALSEFRKALAIRPSFPEAHHDVALLLLLQGNLDQGWREYEWRWKVPNAGWRRFSKPLWDGSALNGRTLLLHAEQGLGDTLQFIRYVPVIKQLGGRVVVESQPPLLRLLASVPDIDQLAARGSSLPSFDLHAPMLSLPGILRTTLANIPATVPYLDADPLLINYWQRKLAYFRQSGPEFMVGIAWQGNPAHLRDRERSIPFEKFAALAQAARIQLVSLQKEPGEGSAGGIGNSKADPFAIRDFGDALDEVNGPFMDTAAIIKNLDLVIACDSAVCHLAGALGAPVWVALPLVPDWRWLLNRDDSPWYPTMRLFRQTKAGEWDDIFQRIAAELAMLVNSRNPFQVLE